VLDHARAHEVVEPHLAILEVILEVDVEGPGFQLLGDPGQCQVAGDPFEESGK
jgi:hypothetical protein